MVANIGVNYCSTRVQLYMKRLKETETEKTIGFLPHFCHW